MSVQVQEETGLVCGGETQRGILNIQKLCAIQGNGMFALFS